MKNCASESRSADRLEQYRSQSHRHELQAHRLFLHTTLLMTHGSDCSERVPIMGLDGLLVEAMQHHNFNLQQIQGRLSVRVA